MITLIKGIKVHRGSCWECPCLDGEYGDCNVLEKKVHYITKEECPIVELPDHGDLVDRDEFIGRLQSWALLIAMGHGDDDEWVKCIGEVCEHLYNAPVVIPAERSEDE